MSTQNNLRTTSRYITTHNAAGLAVFSDSLPDKPLPQVGTLAPLRMTLNYATQNFPVEIDEERDIKLYKQFLEHPPPGLITPNGTAARIVDLRPDDTSRMHRTVSINYNFVIEGEVEIILDLGEVKLTKPGDMLVQRAVNHSWHNPSTSKWARIAAVSFPASAAGINESGIEEVLNST